MNRIVLIGVVVGLVIGGIVIYEMGGTEKLPAPPSLPGPEQVKEDPGDHVISLKDFESLRLGDAYWDITDRFGDLEDVRKVENVDSGQYTRGRAVVWCTWTNPDGSWVKLGFEDERLLDMLQEGLK